MGSFANALYMGLLGWTRMMTYSVWSAFSQEQGTGLFGWIGEHWILLAAVLCGIGLAADLIVYLIRWRPYRVWTSFFRKILHGRKQGTEEALPEESGSSEAPEYSSAFQEETFSDPEIRQEPAADGPADAAERFSGRIRSEADTLPENTVPDSLQNSPYSGTRYRTYDEDSDAVSEMTSRFEQAIRPRRRGGRVARLFRDEEEKTEYTAPQELIDKREAYRKPVYPRNWKGNRDSNT